MQFLKTTVIGGILFLVPVIFFIAVIGKALEITDEMATPLAAVLPVDSIGGLAVVRILAIVILVLICFVAGLAASTVIAKKLVGALEANVLSKLPAYELLKSKSQSILSPEDIEEMIPVVARFDDSWQVAFEIERIERGKVVIFVPGAPDPWSGKVSVVTADRITPLHLTIPDVAKMARRLGRGANEALRDRLPGAEPVA